MRIASLIHLADAALSADQPAVALSLLEVGQRQLAAKPSSNAALAIEILLLLAEASRDLDRWDDALEHSQRAYRWAVRARTALYKKAVAAEMIGSIHDRNKDGAMALRWFLCAVAALKSSGRTHGMMLAFLLVDCARLQLAQGDRARALTSMEESVRLAERFARRGCRQQDPLMHSVLIDLRDGLVRCHGGLPMDTQLETFRRMSNHVPGREMQVGAGRN